MKEYDLYIPISYNDGLSIDLSTIEGIKTDLIDEFYGLTVFLGLSKGYWRDVYGALYEDQNYLFRVIAEDSHKTRQFMLNLKYRLETILDQRSIFIVVRDVEIL